MHIRRHRCSLLDQAFRACPNVPRSQLGYLRRHLAAAHGTEVHSDFIETANLHSDDDINAPYCWNGRAGDVALHNKDVYMINSFERQRSTRTCRAPHIITPRWVLGSSTQTYITIHPSPPTFASPMAAQGRKHFELLFESVTRTPSFCPAI